MANSIYLGGGIKSAFCGGNVKEIHLGTNKLFPSGGDEPMPEGYARVDFLETLAWGNNTKATIPNPSFMTLMRNTDKIIYKLRVAGVPKSTNLGEFSVAWNPNYFSANTDITFMYTLSNGRIYSKKVLDSYDGSFCELEYEKQGSSITKIKALYKGTETEVSFGRTDVSLPFHSFFNAVSNNVGSRFYSFKVIDGETDEVKYNLVPAKRLSDGNPVVVDTITQNVLVCDSIKWQPKTK